MRYQNRPLPRKIRGLLRKFLPAKFYLNHFGRHEMMSLAVWKILSASVPEGGVILDVGAYQAEFAIAAREANPAARIVAFEPNPDSSKQLSEVAQQYDLKLDKRALADASGIRRFRCDSQRSGLCTEVTTDLTVEVGTVSLDEWVRETDMLPFLMKIDVEDGAAEVIQGGSAVLCTGLTVILCEILTNEIGSKIASSLPGTYKFFLINENAGLELKSEIKRLDWRYKNWLLVPDKLRNIVPAEFIV